MAKAHTDGVPSNPDIRFERTDVDIPAIVKGGAYLFLVLIASASLTLWLAWYVTKSEDSLKKTDLPEAKADEQVKGKSGFTTLPPEPRLEALEDVREREKKSFAMYPPRAEESRTYQEDKKTLAEKKPIDKGLAAGDRLFPVRKASDAEATKAPTSYSVALPSKSSAGRRTTGGQ